MINISNDFKTAMMQPIKELDAYILYDDIKIDSADDLIDFKLKVDGGLCKTAMKKCEISFLGDHYLLGKEVAVYIGVKIQDGTFEYLKYGSFLITETTTKKDTDVTNVVGYDSMLKTYIPYAAQHTYPLSLFDYAIEICAYCGIVLGSTEFLNSDYIVENELYENISGLTYRDVLQQIAEVSCSICVIGNDDKLYFKSLENTNEIITYDNLIKLKQEPLYGEINSVVLSRSPQEDNVVLTDQESADLNGITEFKIVNNWLIDSNRESIITSIFNNLKGIKYYPFEADTEGLGWFEVGDKIRVVNDIGVEFETIVLNISLNMNGALKEKLSATASTKTETNYSRAGGITNRLKNTEIQVDKQNQTILSLVSDVYDEDGLINENFTQIYQNLTNIVNAVQNSGGSNILKNSVMFAYDINGNPYDWHVEGDGSLSIQASSESTSHGSVSGNVFILKNKKVIQRVIVKENNETIPENQRIFYTFCLKVKKDSAGTGYIKIFNDNEEYRIDFLNGESPFYGDYEIKAMLPTMNYYDIEIYGDQNSNLTLTDLMFGQGELKSQWQQANGEIMNTQVNISVDGIIVKSSVYLGDYTIMSPLEFAGYSNSNGTLSKVFTLNKDTTEMQKIKIDDELSMKPLKIVPINDDDVNGWAIVQAT